MVKSRVPSIGSSPGGGGFVCSVPVDVCGNEFTETELNRPELMVTLSDARKVGVLVDRKPSTEPVPVDVELSLQVIVDRSTQLDRERIRVVGAGNSQQEGPARHSGVGRGHREIAG